MPRKTMSNMEKVLEVLTNSAEYPAPVPVSARTMLSEGLPHALAAADEHSFQKEIAGLVAGMLTEVRFAAEGVLEAARAQVAEAEAQLQVADAERAAAAERSSLVQEDTQAREAALREAKAAVKANEADHKEAKQAESAVLKEKAMLSARKGQLDELAASIRAYEEGQAEAPVDGVLGYLEEVGAEKALVAAAPGALLRPPAERGAFDALTLAEVSELLSQSLASVAAELAEGERTEVHASAEALGAWAVLDVSQERSSEAALALSAVQGELQAAVAERKAAEATVATRNAEVTDSLVQRTLAEENVSEAKGAESALETLRNPPPPPAVEEVAPAMEVQVAPEAEAAPMEVDAVATPSKVPPAEVGLDLSRVPTPQCS